MRSRAGFPDSVAYEKQRKRGFVACPECGSTRGGQGDHGAGRGWRRRVRRRPKRRARRRWTTSAAELARIRSLSMRREIEANTDDVGAKFPASGESHPSRRRAGARDSRPGEPRGGQSLLEDGVGVLPLPTLEDETELKGLAPGITSGRRGIPAPRRPSCRSSCGPRRGTGSRRGRFDRREPDLQVLVIGHELGRRAVAAMAGYRHVPGRADGDRTVVAFRLRVALADIGEVNVEPGVAVEDRNVRLHAAGGAIAPEAGAGRITAPTGSTTFCLSCGPSGTRSGFSSNGGEMSTPVTALPASAMRIVRVMFELEAMVAKVSGDTRPWTIGPFPPMRRGRWRRSSRAR